MDGTANITGQRLADLIREAILSGKLKPGERIRQDALALKHGASRQPVRDALKILEAWGLVRIVPNTGAWVASLSLVECVEIYRIREQLEPMALADSVAWLTDSQIGTLSLLNDRMAAGVNETDFMTLDKEFHLLSYVGSRLTRLLGMIENFWNVTQPYRRAYYNLVEPERRWITHWEHRLIADAIRRREGVEAGHVLLGHIRRTRTELEKHPELFEQTYL